MSQNSNLLANKDFNKNIDFDDNQSEISTASKSRFWNKLYNQTKDLNSDIG